MASRLAKGALRAARPATRPVLLSTRTLPAASTPLAQYRYNSNVPQQDPKTKAQSLLDALPGQTLASKTAIASGAVGVSVWAISNEIYVVNEESIVMLATLSVFWAIYQYFGPIYSQAADSHADKLRRIFRGAREDHKNAVKMRMDSVNRVGEVVDVTKNLFGVSKETAQLEAQAYELEQKTAVAAEAKSVLDSWVRFEGQQKQRQQQELAQSIIAKVEKELEDPKVLKRILDQSVADVEKLVSQKQ